MAEPPSPGDVWIADLGPVLKVRPVVLVKVSDETVVALKCASVPRGHHTPITASVSGLAQDSHVEIDDPLEFDRSRLRVRTGYTPRFDGIPASTFGIPRAPTGPGRDMGAPVLSQLRYEPHVSRGRKVGPGIHVPSGSGSSCRIGLFDPALDARYTSAPEIVQMPKTRNLPTSCPLDARGIPLAAIGRAREVLVAVARRGTFKGLPGHNIDYHGPNPSGYAAIHAGFRHRLVCLNDPAQVPDEYRGMMVGDLLPIGFRKMEDWTGERLAFSRTKPEFAKGSNDPAEGAEQMKTWLGLDELAPNEPKTEAPGEIADPLEGHDLANLMQVNDFAEMASTTRHTIYPLLDAQVLTEGPRLARSYFSAAVGGKFVRTVVLDEKANAYIDEQAAAPAAEPDVAEPAADLGVTLSDLHATLETSMTDLPVSVKGSKGFVFYKVDGTVSPAHNVCRALQMLVVDGRGLGGLRPLGLDPLQSTICLVATKSAEIGQPVTLSDTQKDVISRMSRLLAKLFFDSSEDGMDEYFEKLVHSFRHGGFIGASETPNDLGRRIEDLFKKNAFDASVVACLIMLDVQVASRERRRALARTVEAQVMLVEKTIEDGPSGQAEKEAQAAPLLDPEQMFERAAELDFQAAKLARRRRDLQVQMKEAVVPPEEVVKIEERIVYVETFVQAMRGKASEGEKLLRRSEHEIEAVRAERNAAVEAFEQAKLRLEQARKSFDLVDDAIRSATESRKIAAKSIVDSAREMEDLRIRRTQAKAVDTSALEAEEQSLVMSMRRVRKEAADLREQATDLIVSSVE